MLNGFVRRSRSQNVAAASVLLAIAILCAIYRRYAVAVVWHCVHGNYARVGGHTVTLPILWWKADADAYDTARLVRASPAGTALISQIVVSPAIPGEIKQTDQEELKATQLIIDLNNRDSIARRSASLIVLRPKPFTLYCKKDAASPPAIDVLGVFSCRAARVQYSFTYDGPPMHEKEGKAILSTLE
jgi:hypothetical protein